MKIIQYWKKEQLKKEAEQEMKFVLWSAGIILFVLFQLSLIV